jgi:hypothetical protein
MPSLFAITSTPAQRHNRRYAIVWLCSMLLLGLTACMHTPTKTESTAATSSLLDEVSKSSIEKPLGVKDYPHKQAKLRRLVLRTLKYDYEVVDSRFTMTAPPIAWVTVSGGADSILYSAFRAQRDRQLRGKLGYEAIVEFWRLPDRPDTLIAVGEIDHFFPGKSHHGENLHMIIGYFELRKKR